MRHPRIIRILNRDQVAKGVSRHGSYVLNGRPSIRCRGIKPLHYTYAARPDDPAPPVVLGTAGLSLPASLPPPHFTAVSYPSASHWLPLTDCGSPAG